MAACSIFDEDEVCMPTSSGGFKYGLVVESSAYVDSSDEEEDDAMKVKPGTVKVAWHPSGDETIVDEKKLILTDRSLMPGDVVRRLISGKDSQRGFVEAMEVKCHCKILGTEYFIYNIDAKLVTPIQVFDAECEVVLDSWVGHVMEVHEDIVVRFSDGARCCLKNAGMLNLEDTKDVRTNISEFAMGNFYPGQELCGAPSDYEAAEWLNTTNLRGPKRSTPKSLYSAAVTVEKVETTCLEVRWMCKGFTRRGAGTDKLESPPTHVEGENLKRMRRLECFDQCHIQIGDRGYYVIKETDTVLLNMSPRKHATPDIVRIMAQDNAIVIGTSADGLVVLPKVARDSKEETEREATPVEETKKTALSNGETVNEDDAECADDEFEDVKEENNEESDASSSSYSEDVSTASRKKNRKRPSLQTRGMKKLKGKRSRKKTKQLEVVVNPGDKVPIEIWYTFSICDVVWQDGSVEKAVPSPELYPIHHLDENEFFPGDFVLDAKSHNSSEYGVIESCDHKERTVVVNWVKPYVLGKTSRPEVGDGEELSVYDIKDHPDYKFRAGHTVIRVGGFQEDQDVEAIGQVYKLDPSGKIHVWWPNNTVTQCYPQDLYIISEEFHSEGGSSSDWSGEEEEEEDGDSDVSWETEGEESVDADTDTDNKKQKALWSVSDSKKNDLDELLQRVHAALTGLLNVFMNQRGTFFKNSRQVFQDILAIFKRCKQMEKILKSSYFDDEEVAGLIAEVKSQFRKETTTNFARHIANVYKCRTVGADSIANEAKETGSESANTEKTKSEKKVDKSGDVANINEAKSDEKPVNGSDSVNTEDSSEAGAVGGAEKPQTPDEDVREKLAKALIEYGSNIEDPILQIIFDTSLHATVSKSAKQDLEAAKGRGLPPYTFSSSATSPTSPMADSREKSVTEMIHSVITTICDQNYDELEKAFQSAKQKVDLACNGPTSLLSLNVYSEHSSEGDSRAATNDSTNDSAESLTKEGPQSKSVCADSSLPPGEGVKSDSTGESVGSSQSTGESSGSSHPTGDSKGTSHSPGECKGSSCSTGESIGNTHPTGEGADISNCTGETGSQITTSGAAESVEYLPPSHRSLCIRVCKALNVRLLYIQQEVNRRWLAFKFGCSDNVTDVELFEKMQAKMIESVETTGEPLKLVSENVHTAENLLMEEVREMGRTEVEGKASPDREDEDTAVAQSPVVESISSGEETVQPDESSQPVKGFQMCAEVLSSHWYKFQEHKPSNQRTFNAAVRKEYKLLQSSLPDGIFVKAFEDRMDLFSVMILGPTHTPYEDGLFSFDIQLPYDFPTSPPSFHYLSFCNERLNPNLYEDGKVCVSLLGTWAGKGNEVWTNKSSLLQVLVSIQGLILVNEPYFNEAGYEKQRGTQLGQENSTMYNEMAVLKLVQSMTKIVLAPPAMFVEETKVHIKKTYQRMIRRIERWIEISNSYRSSGQSASSSDTQSDPFDSLNPVTTQLTGAQHVPLDSQDKGDNSASVDCENKEDHLAAALKKSLTLTNSDLPQFPILPLSKGFCLTMNKHLEVFRSVVREHLKEPVGNE